MNTRLGLLAAAALAALGCSETTAVRSQLLLAKDIIVVTGDSQTAPVHTQLAAPVVVRVLDDSGTPVAGQLVNFVVTGGGGHVFAGSALTDTAGEAREWWTLGDTAATQYLAARAVNPTTGVQITYAELLAFAKPGPLATASFTTRELEVLGDSLVTLPAHAADAYGNAVPPPIVSLDAARSAPADSLGRWQAMTLGASRFSLTSPAAVETLTVFVAPPLGRFRAVYHLGDTLIVETGRVMTPRADGGAGTNACYSYAGRDLYDTDSVQAVRSVAGAPIDSAAGLAVVGGLQHVAADTSVVWYMSAWIANEQGIFGGCRSAAWTPAPGARWSFAGSVGLDSLIIIP